jgi:Fe-S-cluster containining protein
LTCGTKTDKCIKCGKCCRRFGVSLSIDDMNKEPKLWDVAVPIQKINNPKLRKYMIENNHPWAIKLMPVSFACPFLTAQNLCKIYDTRPQVCRDYPQEGAPCRQYVK